MIPNLLYTTCVIFISLGYPTPLLGRISSPARLQAPSHTPIFISLQYLRYSPPLHFLRPPPTPPFVVSSVVRAAFGLVPLTASSLLPSFSMCLQFSSLPALSPSPSLCVTFPSPPLHSILICVHFPPVHLPTIVSLCAGPPPSNEV